MLVAHSAPLPAQRQAVQNAPHAAVLRTYPRLRALGPRPPAVPCSRASPVYASASSAVQEQVELPLQIYKLLQVSQAASRDTCNLVIEKLSSSPPAVGYTEVTYESTRLMCYCFLTKTHSGSSTHSTLSSSCCVQDTLASRERVLAAVGRTLEQDSTRSGRAQLNPAISYSDIPGIVPYSNVQQSFADICCLLPVRHTQPY